jgi:hypothetical protein
MRRAGRLTLPVGPEATELVAELGLAMNLDAAFEEIEPVAEN